MLILLVTLTIPGFAVKYKGFADVDLSYNISYSSSKGRSLSRPAEDRLSLLITTTHGFQFGKSAFVGFGVGLNQLGGELNMRNLPIYLDGRWTLNSSKRFTPFIDLKIGYYLLSNKEKEWFNNLFERENYDKNSYFFNDYYGEQKNGFFIKPTVGCRISLSKSLGLNIGITYLPQWSNVMVYYAEVENGKKVHSSWYEDGMFTRHYLGLNVGVDF